MHLNDNWIICNRCKKNKNISDFYKDRKICKQCTKNYYILYYKSDRKKYEKTLEDPELFKIEFEKRKQRVRQETEEYRKNKKEKYNKIFSKYLNRQKNYNTNVYVMLNPLNNKYKIGKSINPTRRLKDFRSIEPAIELLFHYPADGSDEIELHLKYRDKRLHNEWFSLNEQDLIEIKEYLEGIQDAKA